MKTIKIKCRIIERVSNSFMILAVFMITGVYSCTVQAQSFSKVKIDKGFEATRGVTSFEIKSDLHELYATPIVEEGA